MGGYLVHYIGKAGRGICFDYVQARDGLSAVSEFARRRPVSSIYRIRRLSNGFNPVPL
jgi:hypothetical protein